MDKRRHFDFLRFLFGERHVDFEFRPEFHGDCDDQRGGHFAELHKVRLTVGWEFCS